jgi:ABC-type transport system substrate-binding protein
LKPSRRELLRLLALGAVAGLGAACRPTPTAPGQPGDAGASPTDHPPPTAGAEAPPTSPPATEAPAAPPPTVGAAPSAPTATPAALPLLRIAIDVDPDTLDPAGQTNTTVSNVVDFMVEPLIRLQSDGSLAPGLAERWEQSPDGRTYTFAIRRGVGFHDGTELTADAVRQSLERTTGSRMAVPLRGPFDAALVESITAVDPTTLTLRLRGPFPPFLSYLTGTQVGIVSPQHAQKFPDSYNDEPIGTGPYRFKERRKGESVTLERFDDYWGPRPAFPRVQVRIVPEAATRESLLLANQVELAIVPPASDLPTLQKSGTLSVLMAPTSRTVFVAMDLTLPGGTPLGIKKVRQALNYAVDREGIIKSVLFDAAAPLDAPMAPTVFGYSKTGPYAFDPGKAKQLLLEGGTPQLQLRFIHPTGRSMQDTQSAQVAQAIAGNLREVGVYTDLVGYDWPSYLAAINVPEDKGSAHMHLFTWAPGFLDASQQVGQFVRGQWPPRGLATSHYTNAQVEHLVDLAAREPDQQKRLDLYGQAQRIVWDDAPWIFLWVPSFPIVYSTRVKGVTSLPTEKFNAIYAEPAA